MFRPREALPPHWLPLPQRVVELYASSSLIVQDQVLGNLRHGRVQSGWVTYGCEQRCFLLLKFHNLDFIEHQRQSACSSLRVRCEVGLGRRAMRGVTITRLGRGTPGAATCPFPSPSPSLEAWVSRFLASPSSRHRLLRRRPGSCC